VAETCKTCRFGYSFTQKVPDFYDPKKIHEYPTVVCQRYPKSLDKKPDDWCGEHQHQPAKGEE
jgi:hypothetical protein